ncbi:hypothetical protein EJ110_NYTH08686 [Nymphaea thermarum]|nr:hypothetical protein EJ110_NYTH08686 [Nymphaea thermarum]
MASSDARAENVYMAKVAEQAERFEEMLEFVEKGATAASSDGKDLTAEERHLLSVAYKNVVGSRRAAWRILMSIERSEEKRCNSHRAGTIEDYRSRIESELSSVCGRILRFLDSHLIPSAAAPESKVCFLKMKGDHLRYLAEFKTGTDRKEVVENTLTAYKSAQEIAVAKLPTTHPIRLGLALNFCVFYYEIMGSPDQACALANQALSEANMTGTETPDHGPPKESSVVMQLLRHNLAVWATELQDDDEEGRVPDEE